MKYRITDAGAGPRYLQLYAQLRDDIVAGVYPPGSRLPSKRLLAEELGLSLVTVERAYDLLEQEGYSQAQERRGYFAVYHEGDGFPVAEPVRAIHVRQTDAASGLPFSVLAKTMRRVLSEYGEDLLRRSPHRGCLELRQALSRYLARSRNIHASPEQIVIGAGAEYLYSLALQVLGRDQIYGIEQPSYEKIELVYRANRAAYRLLPLGPEGILSGALAATDASVLHLTPYRSFPSGVTASPAKRREYLRWAAVPGRFLIEDDFESEFSLSTKPSETLFSLMTGDNVVYLNTFSRTLSPAFRMGYMVLPPGLVERFERTVGFYSCTVPNFDQIVVADFIDNGDFERHLNRTRRALRKNSKIPVEKQENHDKIEADHPI